MLPVHGLLFDKHELGGNPLSLPAAQDWQNAGFFATTQSAQLVSHTTRNKLCHVSYEECIHSSQGGGMSSVGDIISTSPLAQAYLAGGHWSCSLFTVPLG